jgi:hypothetical protein
LEGCRRSDLEMEGVRLREREVLAEKELDGVLLRVTLLDREMDLEAEADKEMDLEAEADKEMDLEAEADREMVLEAEADREMDLEAEADKEMVLEAEADRDLEMEMEGETLRRTDLDPDRDFEGERVGEGLTVRLRDDVKDLDTEIVGVLLSARNAVSHTEIRAWQRSAHAHRKESGHHRRATKAKQINTTTLESSASGQAGMACAILAVSALSGRRHAKKVVWQRSPPPHDWSPLLIVRPRG